MAPCPRNLGRVRASSKGARPAPDRGRGSAPTICTRSDSKRRSRGSGPPAASVSSSCSIVSPTLGACSNICRSWPRGGRREASKTRADLAPRSRRSPRRGGSWISSSTPPRIERTTRVFGAVARSALAGASPNRWGSRYAVSAAGSGPPKGSRCLRRHRTRGHRGHTRAPRPRRRPQRSLRRPHQRQRRQSSRRGPHRKTAIARIRGRLWWQPRRCTRRRRRASWMPGPCFRASTCDRFRTSNIWRGARTKTG